VAEQLRFDAAYIIPRGDRRLIGVVVQYIWQFASTLLAE
jgi:hypothetical protein